jgi:hypothetical protein
VFSLRVGDLLKTQGPSAGMVLKLKISKNIVITELYNHRKIKNCFTRTVLRRIVSNGYELKKSRGTRRPSVTESFLCGFVRV